MTAASQHLPAYEGSLEAYHNAFESELRRIVDTLPASAADVMDAGCGDGFYTELLARRLPSSGSLTAIDLSADYLRVAQERLAADPRRERMRFVKTDVERLPFENGAFDLVWCAQSFYSFPNPVNALTELARVTKRGGAVAVLENDTLHHVLLPWPPDVELLVRAAELKAFRAQTPDAEKFYVGRGLIGLFQAAGLEPERKRTFSWDRVAPFDRDCRTFLGWHVGNMRERIRPFLSDDARSLCDPYLDPDDPSYVLNDPLCAVVIIDHVLLGRPRR